MKKAEKAALYSAIVFPGAGLWWLKSYARALVFIVPACITLWHIGTRVFASASKTYFKMQEQAEEGLLAIDPASLTNMYEKLHHDIYASLGAQQQQLNVSIAILIASWICSIVSSYFVGKKIDLQHASNTTSTKD